MNREKEYDNGLGKFRLSSLTDEELEKIKRVEDEINQSCRGSRICLIALDIQTHEDFE